MTHGLTAGESFAGRAPFPALDRRPERTHADAALDSWRAPPRFTAMTTITLLLPRPGGFGSGYNAVPERGFRLGGEVSETDLDPKS